MKWPQSCESAVESKIMPKNAKASPNAFVRIRGVQLYLLVRPHPACGYCPNFVQPLLVGLTAQSPPTLVFI